MVFLFIVCVALLNCNVPGAYTVIATCMLTLSVSPVMQCCVDYINHFKYPHCTCIQVQYRPIVIKHV